MLKTNDIVPCGKCADCKGRRVSAWSFRLREQSKIATSAVFLTLTFDTDHVPVTPRGFMNLSKRELQLFFKRLRKSNPVGIKYYAAGEYGGKTFRPHYHVILFNAALDTIAPAWSLGHIHYGSVTAASIGYCLKYISKPARIPLHKNDDRQREFSLMSKGLGLNYLSPQQVRWHRATNGRMHCTLDDGKKCTMPRYFKEKIYSPSERALEAEIFQLEKLLSTPVPDDLRASYLARREAVKASQRAALYHSLQNNKL